MRSESPKIYKTPNQLSRILIATHQPIFPQARINWNNILANSNRKNSNELLELLCSSFSMSQPSICSLLIVASDVPYAYFISFPESANSQNSFVCEQFR